MSASAYEVVIGLEVHCQLKTESKLFTDCACGFGAEPNVQSDPYTWALPGTLPVPNRAAVELGMRLALAVGAEIQARSIWARKHYFYPDSPQGYQITQNSHPYCLGGGVELLDDEGKVKQKVRLHHIHLEADAGKSTHVSGEAVSLLDFNRAGAPLVEIVSEPDLRSASDAADYLRELRTLVRFLGISDANMEEGTLRCDANVSLRPKGSETLGTRCEIKNLNSFKFVESAILAEMRRQEDLLSRGEKVVQSTMAYDADKDRTWVMRSKEDAADYLYFPEPDLPPLDISEAWIEQVKAAMPELLAERRARYETLGLSAYDRSVLCTEPALADYFDQMLESEIPAKKACNWLSVELVGQLNRQGLDIQDCPMPPAHLAQIVQLLQEDAISGPSAKKVFEASFQEGLEPKIIVERDGHRQVSDTGAIEEMLRKVLEDNPKQVAAYKNGQEKLRGFFVGQVMKASQGQANPKLVNQLLDSLLSSAV